MSETPVAYPPSIPPRGEDLPYSDGKPMESVHHVRQMTLLIQTLRDAWGERRDFFVGGNMFMYFSEPQAKKNDFLGPDVFVVMNALQRERLSWVVWEEDGLTPDVVVELVSPTTEANDRGPKKEIYRKALKVSRYFVFDPISMALEGWVLMDDEYVPLEPAEDGSLDCGPLGLRLGVRDTHYEGRTGPLLRWIDPEGRVLPTAYEVRDVADEARRSVVRAQNVAEASERRAAEAEQSARDARDAAQQAERDSVEAQRRAEAERERTDAERERADALARRIAELERGD